MLRANALEVLDIELTRPKYRLEELIQETRRAREEIRKVIRKIKLEFTIAIVALTTIQILLRWIRL
jgi:hypothetical protein